MISTGDYFRSPLLCLVTLLLAAQPALSGNAPVAKKAAPVVKASTTATKSAVAPKAAAPALKLAGGKPTVLDFGAGWCVPCKVFAPVFTKVKTNLAAKAQFQSIDSESTEGEKLANKYGVSGLPTIIILDSAGKVVFKKSGIMDEKALTAEVTKAIGN